MCATKCNYLHLIIHTLVADAPTHSSETICELVQSFAQGNFNMTAVGAWDRASNLCILELHKHT